MQSESPESALDSLLKETQAWIAADILHHEDRQYENEAKTLKTSKRTKEKKMQKPCRTKQNKQPTNIEPFLKPVVRVGKVKEP